jgi:hypothetical protein
MTLFDQWSKIKRFFPPSNQEWLEFFVVSFVIGFILSFNAWGADNFDLAVGLRNLLISSVLSIITLAIHHGAQRLMALNLDMQAEHRAWWGGMLVALLLAVITRGALPFVTFTRTEIEELKYHRLGHFRYKAGTVSKMWVYLAGPMANAVVALLFWWLVKSPSDTITSFIHLNLLFALIYLLPIPPLDGCYIFFVSRTFLAVVFGGVLAAAIAMISGLPGWIGFLFVVVVIIAVWSAWDKQMEGTAGGRIKFFDKTHFFFINRTLLTCVIVGVIAFWLGLILGLPHWVIIILVLVCMTLAWYAWWRTFG